MKALLTFTLSMWLALSVAANPLILLSGSPPAAGGGSPAWSDIETSANGNNFPAFNSTEYYSGEVIAGQTGTCTKIRVYITANGGASNGNLKAAVYNAAGTTVLGSGSVVVAPADDNTYKEITVSFAVTASTAYRIAIMGDNPDVLYTYNDATGSTDIFVGKTFASFPYASMGTVGDFDNFQRNLCVGIYIEP